MVKEVNQGFWLETLRFPETAVSLLQKTGFVQKVGFVCKTGSSERLVVWLENIFLSPPA